MSVITKDLGMVTAYAYAVSKGYTGTEEQFAELMASYASTAQTAVEAAERAVAAQGAAELAQGKAEDAQGVAEGKATEASGSADSASADALKAEGLAVGQQNGTEVGSGSPYYHNNAEYFKEQASSSATTASNKAGEAAQSATDASNAKIAAQTAQGKAEDAQIAAETAQGKAEDAQEAAEAVAQSIPADYSELSADVGNLKSAIDVLQDAAEEVGTVIQKVNCKITWAWTDVRALSDLTLKAGKTYKFSIKGNASQTRYMNLFNSSGTSLKSYNQTQDGSMTYTPSADLEGCYLQYNSNANGAEAAIWYEVLRPNLITDDEALSYKFLPSADPLTNKFIKELYIESADPNTTYKFYFAAKNHSTAKYNFGLGINGTTTIVSYLQSQATEPQNVVVIPAYGGSGKKAYAVLDWSVLEDGSNTEYNIKLKDTVKDLYNSPTIFAYLQTVDIPEIEGCVFKDFTVDFTEHSSKRLNTNGTSQNSSLSNEKISTPINISGLKKVVYTTNTNNPYCGAVSFTKSDTYPIISGDVVSCYVRTAIGTFELNVPDGANYAWLSSDMDVNGDLQGTPSLKGKISVDDFIAMGQKTDTIDGEIKIAVPSVINCFVGETLQLYYRSIFLCVDPYQYDIKIQCNIGDQFPRYFEVTPIAANVGDHALKIAVQTNNGKLLGSKTVTLKVHSAPSSPSANKNVLVVGASCTQNGEWVGEMKRVLAEVYNLSNISFVGRKEVNGVKLEATGGYEWSSYTSTSVTNLYKFFFTSEHLPSIVNIGNVYSNNSKSFTVTEINIPTPDGGGYISCTGTGAPSASGTLTLTSGQGDASLTFSSSSVSGNPFLYNGAIDIQQYATDYCGGQIDVVYTELFVNGTEPYNHNVTSMMNAMKVFCQNIHSAFPSCKIALGMPYCPDIRGGMGVNYHAAGGFSFGYGIKTTFMEYMLQIEKYLEDNNLDGYVSIVNWLNEFDCENDFRQTTKPVNTRSQVTEIFGVNGIHPSNVGYYQMADSAVRHFVANFCQ